MTWSVRSSNTLSQVPLNSSPPGNTGRQSIMIAWSGGCFDPTRRRLVINGGGHSDYAGNEVCAFDVVSGLWSILKHPTPNAQINDNQAENDDGTPNSRHTYSGLCYVESEDAMFMLGNGLWPSQPGAVSLPDAWLFYFSTNTWLRLPDWPGGISNIAWYESGADRVGLITDAGDIRYYTLATGVWSTTGNLGVGNIGVLSVTATYSPVTNKVYLAGSSIFNPPQVLDVSVVPPTRSAWGASVPGLNGAAGPGLVADPSGARVYVWVSGNQAYEVNLLSNAVTALATTGVTVTMPSPNNGVFGRCQLDRAGDQLLVVNTITGPVYGNALADAPGPGPTGMPSISDEQATYSLWGWTWSANQEPINIVDPRTPGPVTNPDIHGDTEADDLWTYAQMVARGAGPAYVLRRDQWARYFKDDYAQGIGTEGRTYVPFDTDSFGGCHTYGPGLLLLADAGDAAAMTAALGIGVELQRLWGPTTPYGCVPAGGCLWYGSRGLGRQLKFATMLAARSADPQWTALRDQMIQIVTTSSQWDEVLGSFFYGDWQTDQIDGAGAYAAGTRLQSPFETGVFAEGLWEAYRETGNAIIRARIVRMAEFVRTHAIHPTTGYTGSWYGVKAGAPYQYDNGAGLYTTQLTNLLVMGYKLSGLQQYLDKAKTVFAAGTHSLYGTTVPAGSPGVVHHFMDTLWDTSSANLYLDRNKAELYYTYLIFENGGLPTVESVGAGTGAGATTLAPLTGVATGTLASPSGPPISGVRSSGRRPGWRP